ncbi:MAG: hypothetical protein ISS49_16785 [Anaerolineae bacterium]|nr:hypothetical protein [Anaerolineae bacterium]
MPSDKEFIREIETHVTTLVQTVAAAEDYYKQYIAEIERALQERLATNQAEYDQAMDRIQQEHQQAVEAVRQELREVEQACGLWATAWDDPAWETFESDLEAPVPYLTRLGQLKVSGALEQPGKSMSIAEIAAAAVVVEPVTQRKGR